MRRVGKWCWLVLVAFGCTPTYNDLRPNRPDDYQLPPEGMYTGDPTYPKEYLNQFAPRKEKDSTDGLPPAQSGRFGGMGPSGSGMGR